MTKQYHVCRITYMMLNCWSRHCYVVTVIRVILYLLLSLLYCNCYTSILYDTQLLATSLLYFDCYTSYGITVIVIVIL
jgi:hypothetical protein